MEILLLPLMVRLLEVSSPEAGLINIITGGGVAGVVAVFCWLFWKKYDDLQKANAAEQKIKDAETIKTIAQKDQQITDERDRFEKQIREERDRFERERKEDRLDYQNRLDKFMEKNSTVTTVAIDAINSNTNLMNQILNYIKEHNDSEKH